MFMKVDKAIHKIDLAFNLHCQHMGLNLQESQGQQSKELKMLV
jgi:hypothetical protein